MVYLRIREKLAALAQEPRPHGIVKLKGDPAWRIRVGVYRIVLEIDDTQRRIVVAAVGHRREIYR